MKFLAVIIFFSILCGKSALAFTCVSHMGRAEISVGKIVNDSSVDPCIELIEQNRERPTLIILKSPGGMSEHMAPVVADLRRMIAAAKITSHLTPVVVVKEICGSACLPVLAAMNKTAGEHGIILVVDPQTDLSFHGAIRELEYTVGAKTITEYQYWNVATVRYLHFFSKFGANFSWLVDHDYLFRKKEITSLKPDDPRLRNSNILNHALILDADRFLEGDGKVSTEDLTTTAQ